MDRPGSHSGPPWRTFLIICFLILPASPAMAACGGQTVVSSEADFNTAIASFNGQSSPCIFGIEFDGDIPLTASTTSIDNGNPGVELHIDGLGDSLDGQYIQGVRPLFIAADTVVSILDLTVENADVTPGQLAGGIYNAGVLTLTDCTIANNTADSSGGVYNAGTLTISRCSIFGNSATGPAASGGGIGNSIGGQTTVTDSVIAGNDANRGGGLHNNNGTVVVERTLFTNNSASLEGGALYLGNGGAMTVINSTLSGNEAQLAGGGGVYANSGTLELTHVTVTGNTGSGVANSAGAVTIHNSAFAANPDGGDCRNLAGSVTVAHSLMTGSGATGCGLAAANPDANGNIVGQDPLFGPLQSNGGPSETHALGDGSPAIDAGDDALAVDDASQTLEHDQRGPGYPRRTGYAVDMGAFEVPGAMFLHGFEDR